MNLLVGICTLLLVVIQDLTAAKDPIDEQGGDFDIIKDWLKKRYDNVAGMIVSGLIGWALAGELAIPLINKYLDWPELAETAIDLTGIFLVTFVFAKYLKVIFGLKK